MSVVMFWPNTISSARPFTKSASVSRARAMQRVGLFARGIAPVRVGVVIEEIVVHRVDDGARHLRSARAVEVRDGMAVVHRARARESARGCLRPSRRRKRRGADVVVMRSPLRPIVRSASRSRRDRRSRRARRARRGRGRRSSCVTGAGTRFSRAMSAAMPMSFSSSARRKVRGNARVSTRSGMRFIEEFERPLDALMTSSAIVGSTPSFTSVASPSAADSRWIGEERLVHRLDRVARADVAAVDDLLAERLEHRPHAIEHGGVAADHDRERSLLRAGHAAADRCVDEVRRRASASRCAMRRDVAGSPDVQSTSVAPRLHAGEEAVGVRRAASRRRAMWRSR